MFDPARTRMRRIWSGFTSCSITSGASHPSSDGRGTPHGYGLIDTPGHHDRVAGCPSAPTMRSASKPPPVHLEETPLPVERIGAGGESFRRELRGDDAVERRASDMQRLRHGAEADADACATCSP